MILIVGSSRRELQDLQPALEAAGYAVAVSGTASGAAKFFESLRPELIIIDGALEHAEHALLRLIRRTPRLGGVAVLVVSSINAISDIVESLALGADDYLAKPYEV